jgi:hypothetical protein
MKLIQLFFKNFFKDFPKPIQYLTWNPAIKELELSIFKV